MSPSFLVSRLGASVESDVYGKALIEAGVPAEAIKNWSSDPAVTFEGQVGITKDTNERAQDAVWVIHWFFMASYRCSCLL